MGVEVVPLQDQAAGLDAVLVFDDGGQPVCAGGTRTHAYAHAAAALDDARALARAMRLKNALAGLPVGGAKIVVRTPAPSTRAAAFGALGQKLAPFAGRLHTAGDLGTTPADLRAMQQHFEAVHVDDDGSLARAVGETVWRCAVAALDGHAPGSVAVQGAGDIGGAVLARFVRAGAAGHVCDLDESRAREVARAAGGHALDGAGFYPAPVDVLSPCARGGLLDDARARVVRARAVVGGANNMLSHPAVARALVDRGVRVVPDPLSSSGAVIVGACRHVLDGVDPAPHFARVADLAAQAVSGLQRGRTLDEVLAALLAGA